MLSVARLIPSAAPTGVGLTVSASSPATATAAATTAAAPGGSGLVVSSALDVVLAVGLLVLVVAVVGLRVGWSASAVSASPVVVSLRVVGCRRPSVPAAVLG